MKAFVIKNKEGKYDGWDSWEEDIRYAFNYPSEEGAECAIRQLGFEDCTVVPITIYEGDPLELACESVAVDLYGIDYEELEKCGSLENYFIQQAKENIDER